VAGIPTHAELSVASLALGQVSVSVMGLAGVEPIDGSRRFRALPPMVCPRQGCGR
jgi:hypothetical protein